MSMTRTELTWAERAYRLVTRAIPPILASGHVSRSVGFWLAGVFLGTLVLAAISAYLSNRHRCPMPSNTRKRSTVNPLDPVAAPAVC